MRFVGQFEAVPRTFPLALPLLLLLSLVPLPVHAQQQPAVGSIEGDDLTVSSGTSTVNVSPSGVSAASIMNGSVVIVRSGQARLMLTFGGEVDICGPARMTLLQSGESVTVALDFGRLHIQLPSSTSFRVFTPTIVATPLAINGSPGDVSVSLEGDSSLCVRASSGALLLESQFSSDKIVVPQAGQFYFAQGRLVPVARADMQCECVLKQARIEPPAPPQTAILTAPSDTTPPASAPAQPEPKPAEQPSPSEAQYSVLAGPNDSHPLAVKPNAASTAPPAPPDSAPFYQIVMPPLTFSASSPAPPPLPAEDMILLIRTAQVDPDFEFSGHVNPPPLDNTAENHAAEKRGSGRQPKPAGEKPGFWAKLKRFFVGRSS
jgi:hypothetical protein